MAISADPAAAVPASPNDKQRKALERRERQRLARERLYPILAEVFPDAFCLPAKPLAIGIYHQILEVAGDSIDADELSAFMGYWCTRWSYMRAVWQGEPRVNLDGTVAGYPTLDQRNQAGRQLWGERYWPIAEAEAA